MKRVAVFLIVLLFALGTIPAGMVNDVSSETRNEDLIYVNDDAILSDVSDSGNEGTAVAFMSRTVNGQTLDILNSYSTPNIHSGDIDLSSYLIPGWNLYEVAIESSGISAVLEYESLGITANDYINTENASGLIRDAIYQAFYNQPHDGKLNNYSFNYLAFPYDNSLGEAFLVVRSNASDSNTNMTGYITPFDQVLSYTLVTHDCSADNAILDASTYYYAVIDGTTMEGAYTTEWIFNTIYWQAQYPLLGLETGYHIRDGVWDEYDSGEMREAELDYTYTPWNTTTSSALSYSNPTTVSLEGNSSTLTEMTWTFTGTNVSYLEFDSSQSVEISYNLKLSYKKQITTISLWKATVSGQDIQWNVSTDVAYPAVSELRYLNFSIPETRTLTGLYNSSNPTTNHGNYESYNGIARCSNMGNDTWTLTATSRNFLTTIQTYDTSDDSAIINIVRMDVDIDINSTIIEEDSDAVVTGTANLTILFSGSQIWNPSTQSVTDGTMHYLWDIGATATSNGLYTIQEFWSNGTEAGYRTRNLTLYFPTTLTPTQTQIDGFTDNTIDISVDFDDTFTPQGLDDSFASLLYSFDGGANASLNHQTGGTWTASVDTTGKAPAAYSVIVYAEGYALENRSTSIDVTLIHETEALVISWSNGFDISYVQTTELSIGYNRVGGSPIPTASVNVTIGTTTWELPYDSGSETFKITFNGTDAYPGFGNHSIEIDAALDGYESQSDDTRSITQSQESTGMIIDWSNGKNITYIEYTILTVNYTMSNGSAVTGATINITISGSTLDLHESGIDGTYYLRFNGSDSTLGFDDHDFTISAWKYGYDSKAGALDTLTLREVPTLFDATWIESNSITYVQSTILSVNYTMIDGTPVTSATVWVTIDATPWLLSWDGVTETYRKQFNGDDDPPGFGVHTLDVNASKLGHQNHTSTPMSLTIDIESTSLVIDVTPFSINYTDYTTLYVNYLMSNSSPISDGTVTVTIGGSQRSVDWNGTGFELVIYGNDASLIFEQNNITIQASNFGYASASNSDYNITLGLEPTSMSVSWSNGYVLDFFGYSFLIVEYTYKSGTPVLDAIINVTIGTHRWDLQWNETAQYYQLRFNGSDTIPGVGTHSLLIRAGIYGYVQQVNSAEQLTLPVVPTTLSVVWTNGNNITYVESTTIRVTYDMYNGTHIDDAWINITIGATTWNLTWSSGSNSFERTFYGYDIPPGFGTHQFTIWASLEDFETQTSSDGNITLREQPTIIAISWSNGFDLDFFGYSFLIVEYTYAGGTPVLDALINVTIGTHTWDLEWNSTADYYQLRFNGSDTIPGVGTHNLTIEAGKFGYTEQYDDTKTLILPEIPTTLILQWTNGFDISYIEETTLRVTYEMYDTTKILGATLNVTVDGTTYNLDWSIPSQAYEYTFHGNGSAPSFGTFSVLVLAWKQDFVSQTNSTYMLSISVESTTWDIVWTNGNNIGYHSNTTLSVAYLESDGFSSIQYATLNATIGGTLWDLDWNPANDRYEATIYGSDIPPGFGNHTVVIEASRYGFVSQIDSSHWLKLRVEDTSLTFEWIPSNSMTYVGETTLRIFYLMSNDSWIVEATVTVNITLTMWVADWNSSTNAYEVTFYGDDSRLTFATHTCIIQASKTNYQSLLNTSQTLTKNEELTFIVVTWTNGNDITYSESTTLLVNFTMSNGTEIQDGTVTVCTSSDTWDVLWDPALELYKISFSDPSPWPGLGVHGLEISCNRSGYVSILDTSESLTILGENGEIDSFWIGDGSITFIESDMLVVNYTIANGTAITGATVNITIGLDTWDLVWHEASETYQLMFNGTDNPPGIGVWVLEIEVWRQGYDWLPDTSLILIIIEDPTALVISWSNTDSITYFDHTYLFVTYTMSNTSIILGASVNVTIGGITHNLIWNNTQGAYGILLNGSDNPPGLGSHSLVINASKYGFSYSENLTETLTLSKDPTTIEVMWPDGSSITYVESTILRVYYRMSNGSPITTGILNVAIGVDDWELVWNATTQAYHTTFTGDMNPPGLGTFTLSITASGDIFASQSTSTSLTITEEPTSANAAWLTYTIDWTQSVILGIDYMDNSGLLIEDATQKTITVDGFNYLLQGTNGTYWIEFNNSFDLGHHNIIVNISKFGYEYAVNASISFDIVEANTDLVLVWNFITIDYLGQIILSADYTYSGTGDSIPIGLVEANITIDGITTLNLIPSGNLWTRTLDGDYLNLGSHSVVIRCQAYGYTYAESSETLSVTEVSTISSEITWTPSNLTIEYTESLELVMDYTHSVGDVPATAIVNVTIDGRLYNLTYSAGAWRVSIPGSDLGIGIFDADISAWLYGYELRTNVTTGINVTLAANSFLVTWEPWNLTPTYIDQVNLTVVYTEDFSPILDATVKLYINGSDYDLVYSAVDEMWHFSIDAATIDLGVWNVTVTANKTGYADGFFTDILTVVETPTTFSLLNSGTTFYYDEITTIDVYYQLVNLSSVPGAGISFALDSIEQTTVWNADHWSTVLNGTVLDIGVHTFSISVSVYGYETQSDTLEITVLQITTSIITDADFAMYARESVSFRFTYIDDRTSTPIFATEFEYIWSEFYTVNMLPNYTFVVTIGGSDFHVGNYTFQLTMGRLGFENSTDSVDIVVMPIPTEFVYYPTFSQYENETILIEVQLFDSAHSTPIDWANVTIELEGVGYIAIYDGSNYTYSVSFRLPARITPGNYNLWLYGDAEDCIFAMELAEVEILAKSTYLLSLMVVEQIQAGSNINVSITLTEDDQPVAGIYVTITIVVHFSEGGQQIIVEGVTTDVNGFVLVTLEVPIDASDLEVSARFQGSISEWPAEASVVLVDVTPVGTGTGAPIIADPLIIGIVTVGISLPILALSFRRRRRGSGRVTSAVSVAPSPSIPQLSTSASGMLQNVIDEIRNSEDGITRAELSRRLGPSASKIGSMVKDLLGTELGFYEVRDGAKKLIKFKDERFS